MFTKNKSIIAGFILATGASSAYSQDKITLSVVHDSPPSHVTVTHGVEPWMQCVKEGTNGLVDFRYYPGGQLAKNAEMLKALNSGVADVAPVPIAYVSDKLPLNTVATLPGLGGGTSVDMVRAYSQSIQSGPLAREIAGNKMVPLWVKLSPPYQIVSAVGPLRTLEDFKGKVLRSAGGSLNFTIEEMGASPAEISIGDSYIAMERGTVDGTISFLSSLKPYNLHELMNAVSLNGDFGSFPLMFAVRKQRWDTIPPETQAVMTQCGSEVQTSFAEFNDEERANLYQEFADQGVDVYEFAPEDLNVINDHLKVVLERWVSRLAGRGLPAQEVLDTYRGHLNEHQTSLSDAR